MADLHKSLTPDERNRIMADPTVQAIMRDPRYSTPMLRDGAVNNYLANDPRSPFRYLFGAESNLRDDGVPAGGLHYDPTNGQTQFTNTYGHPGTMRAVGLGAVGAAGGLAAAGLLPGLGGASAAGSAAAGSALPATIPGSYASNLYAAGGFGVPGGTASGVAAGLGGLGAAGAAGAAGGAGGAAAGGFSSGLLDQLTSGRSIAGLAGLIATLASKPGGSGGSGDPFAMNPQLQHMLDVASQRVDRTDPLHQSITQLAMGRLPVNVQR
jgi:hypothetical protein